MAEPFEVLGIPATSGIEEARIAFKRLAFMYHPDRYIDAPPTVREEAERRMRDINGAFATFISRQQGSKDAAVLLQEDPWLASWWTEWERRRTTDQARAARHRRWDDLERARKEREELERSSVQSMWRMAYGQPEPADPQGDRTLRLPESTTTMSLDERLRRAKAEGKAVMDPSLKIYLDSVKATPLKPATGSGEGTRAPAKKKAGSAQQRRTT